MDLYKTIYNIVLYKFMGFCFSFGGSRLTFELLGRRNDCWVSSATWPIIPPVMSYVLYIIL